MNLFSYIPCWLIPLIVGAICALLGYLLGKLFGKGSTNEDINIWKNKVTSLETDLEACRKERLALETDLDTCNKSKVNLEADLSTAKANLTNNNSNISSNTNIASSFTGTAATLIPFDSAIAKAAFGKKVKQDDLKIVEGIGPKIEQLFHGFDIKTWKDLGETSVEKCQEVLNSGGERYRVHKPTTWPEQAKLAYEGKWAALKAWQDELDGGK
ncbi:hypothetical protein OAT18_03060 [Tenacibaculum sp.]|nr:hypothetical protein [Tenacibaculum sp.]